MQTRRQFLATSSASVAVTSASVLAGAALGPLTAVAAPAKSASGHVVQITDDRLTKNDRVDPAVAQPMLSRGLQELTGIKKPADAWASLFSAKDLVGIKINCLGKPCMSSTPEVVRAIIAGLVSAGVREDRIVVFDLFGSHMQMSRFRLQPSEKSVRYVHNKQWGYEDEKREVASGGRVQFSKVLMQADKIISVPVIKDHALSGVTCSLKNMAFGCIGNPSAFHRESCHPGIANIYNLPPIRDKVRLIVCDAAFMQYDGGPQCKPAARLALNSLFLTADPVAMDKLAWELIDERRKEKRLPLVGKKREPKHIALAAGLGLGTDDRSRIKLAKPRMS